MPERALPPPRHTRCEIFIRYVFVIFLAGTFYYVLPDKVHPRLAEEYDPILVLLPPEDFHARRCQSVTPSKKYIKFSENLMELARELNYPVLTAAHVGYNYCMLVTRFLNDDKQYSVLLNPAILSVEGPHYAKIQSVLCKRMIQRKKLFTRLRFTHGNFTEPAGLRFSTACPDPDCAAQLFQAFEILNGTFRCS